MIVQGAGDASDCGDPRGLDGADDACKVASSQHGVGLELSLRLSIVGLPTLESPSAVGVAELGASGLRSCESQLCFLGYRASHGLGHGGDDVDG